MKKIRASTILLSLNLILFSLSKFPDVAGKFYPATKNELLKLFKNYEKNFPSKNLNLQIKIAISPHAGYIYSGKTAYFTYNQLRFLKGKIKNIIIIAPTHFYIFEGFALWKEGVFKTPIGDLEVNSKISKEIVKKIKNAHFHSEYFRNEHAIETQLPFIKYFLGNVKIVPIIIGKNSKSQLQNISNFLSKFLKKNDTIMIISTDMSHYHKKNEANRIDEKAIKIIASIKPETFYRNAALKRIELCGWRGVYIGMKIAKKMGLKFKKLHYEDSSETTGNNNFVVGYLSAVFYKNSSKENENKRFLILKESSKKKLLEIARISIENYLNRGVLPEIKIKNPELKKPYGVFVTIKKYNKLRGCIGILKPIYPLYIAVEKASIESAFNDPRFPPLKENELKKIKIEISVLSKFYKVNSIKEIKVGRDGLLIVNPNGSGLLLPQVAKEYGWNKFEFLKHTCIKAGLKPDCWKRKETTIYRFEAIIFGEK